MLQLVLPCGKGWHFHSRSLWKQGSPFHNPARGFPPSDELPATAVTYHTLQGITRDCREYGAMLSLILLLASLRAMSVALHPTWPGSCWRYALQPSYQHPRGKSEDSPPGSASLYTPSACRAGYTERGFCLQYHSTVWRATVRTTYPQKMRLGSRHFWKIDVMRSTILSPHKSRWFSACPV